MHFGSRLTFLPDGSLLFTVGERGDRDRAQSFQDHAGKTLRILEDGAIPQDNPFVGRSGTQPEIYTYGHRNAQGIAVQPGTGLVWQHEHGLRGGDEVNLIEPGRRVPEGRRVVRQETLLTDERSGGELLRLEPIQ